jgi:hypothetical protein
MTLPPLYKYLDVNGAKLTLNNRTLSSCEALHFRDSEDMTIQSVFPEDVEATVTRLADCCVDVFVENIDAAPTCRPELAQTVQELQAILKADPTKVETLKQQMKELGIFDADSMRASSDAFVKETNEFLQRYRIFCATTTNSSERMWEDYAQDHEGIVLRLEPSVEQNSKFLKFRAVAYHALRPPIYEQTTDYMNDSLFADQEARTTATCRPSAPVGQNGLIA